MSETDTDAIPFRERKIDWLFVGFFILNITFITYIVDLEQLVIDDPNNFEYPLWPPAPLVDLVHWWGNTFDPPQLAREAWWRATIWIDVLFFGPFYAFAIYAYVKGKNWIRLPSIIWSSVMMTNVFIICFEELVGSHPTPEAGMVLFANAPWFVIPIVVIARMWKSEKPFARATSQA